MLLQESVLPLPRILLRVYGSMCTSRHINELAGKPPMCMPVPCFNVINGGVHAGNFLAFQVCTLRWGERMGVCVCVCERYFQVVVSKIFYFHPAPLEHDPF